MCPQEFYVGDGEGTQTKRKLIQIAASLASKIAEKMAQRGPEKAFKAFEGAGHTLEDARPFVKKKKPAKRVIKYRATDHVIA